MITIRHLKPGRGILAAAVGILAAVLILQMLWFLLLAPRLTIKKITMESDLALTDGQLLEMLRLEGETWASLEEAELQRRLESYPVIRKARVVKVFPDTLKLYLYRRRPLAVALTETDEGSIPAVFDEEGYAVQIGKGSTNLDLPVLSGLEFTKPALGARMPDTLQGVLSDLSALRAGDPRLFALISEVAILPRAGGGFELEIFLNHIPIPVRIDNRITAESIRRAVLVLDVLVSSGGDVEEADMRGGNVVFRRVEGS